MENNIAMTNKNMLRTNLNRLASALLIIFLIGFGACSDDGDENGDPTVSFNFNTVNTASGISAGGRILANTLAFTSGTITLSEIQFEAETDEGDSIEVDFGQNVVIDFATGESTPDVSGLAFTPGTYAEASVELELLDEGSTPSVILEGTFVDREDQSHAIRFEFNSGETFEVEKEGNIVINADASVVAEVTFDPVTWFAEVSSAMLENATKNDQDVIVISETSNAEIFNIVADGLDLATEVEIQM